ncbi:hypothetical protein GCM10022225_64440 [Plantactinospora mayteni]|uniref:DUF3024 domain-containing protein n=1 Tax=Plantactinospora mayteni TaxID=566021 RepID=A0ABQ4F0P1_9ACTN|nr:hypothetical protein [Plantactinospora mayteni]GIH00485.1 hypothetical protein Pma05_70570 [Plantactinospora mayteni]
MSETDQVDGPGSNPIPAATVPPTTQEVVWSTNAQSVDTDLDRVVNRYGVVNTLLAAGIDPTGIRVYQEPVDYAVHWVVVLADGRNVVLTDDTEEHVSWLEGRWPFAATFSGRDGVRTEIDGSIDRLMARIVAWCIA